MAVDKKTITIDYNSGSPIFNPVPGSTNLNEYDWVTLQLSNLPKNSDIEIKSLQFYENTVNANGKDEKNTEKTAGSWSRSGGPSSLSVFTVAASGSDVTITDEEAPTADDKYWFSVNVDGTGAPSGGWTLDPELINKRKP